MARQLAIMIGVALALLAPNLHAQVKDEIDRFTGDREIAFSSPGRTAVGEPDFVLEGSVKNGRVVMQLKFIVANTTDRRKGTAWKYLSCHTVDWLVDGTPLQLDAATHRGIVARGGVIEILSQFATPEQLDRIGEAQRVEFRICGDEFLLADVDREGVRSVANKVKGIPTYPTDAELHPPVPAPQPQTQQ